MKRFTMLYHYFASLATGKMPYNYTPLQYAAFIGDSRAIKVLLEHGADINEGTGEVTPLQIAIYAGKADTVRLLLEAGAKISVENLRKAITWAESAGHEALLQLLKQAETKSSQFP